MLERFDAASRKSAPWRSRAFASLAVLLSACAAKARYVVVSDDPRFWTGTNLEQRLIWLSPADAEANAPMLGLVTETSVQEYGQARSGDRGPVEEVLLAIISRRYEVAEGILNARASEIPEYLRRLLAADLASERSADAPVLSKMYQEAYDVQESETARNLIKLRIRQLRYRR